MTYDIFCSTFFDIKGLEGYYQINLNCQVRSLDRDRSCDEIKRVHKGRLLSVKPDPNGYLRVGVCHPDGKLQIMLIHRLLASTFLPNKNNHPIVRHLDDNPGNNDLRNLKWGTYKENRADMFTNGYVAPKGESHFNHGREKEKKIILDNKSGVYYYGIAEASTYTGINQNTLRCKLSGHLKNNTSLIYV